MTAARKTTTAFATVVALLVVAVAYLVARQPVEAHHQPADKVAAAGSRVVKFGPGVPGGTTLLTETMKVATPTDVLLSVTAECSILTQLTTADDQESQVRGIVRVWIEIDGTPVGVTTPSDPQDGKVVFCDRMHEQQFTDAGNDDSFTLRDYQLTRTANGFNWISKNPTSYDANGDNILTIVVKADFELTASGVAIVPPANLCTGGDPETPPEDQVQPDCVQAFVGARTLIAEPTKLTGHEQVTETDTGGF